MPQSNRVESTDLVLRPENTLGPTNYVIGIYKLEARESAAQVPASGDLELDMTVYQDGTVEIDNDQDPDHGDWHRVRLSPSQVAAVRLLLEDPDAVPPYRPEVG